MADERGNGAQSRRRFLAAGAMGMIGLAATPACARSSINWGDRQLSWIRPKLITERSLSFRHRHTDESLNTVYYANGRYIPSALQEVDWLLRDFRSDRSRRSTSDCWTCCTPFGNDSRRNSHSRSIRRTVRRRRTRCYAARVGASPATACTCRGWQSTSDCPAVRRGISPIAPCRFSAAGRNLSPIDLCAPGRGRSQNLARLDSTPALLAIAPESKPRRPQMFPACCRPVSAPDRIRWPRRVFPGTLLDPGCSVY